MPRRPRRWIVLVPALLLALVAPAAATAAERAPVPRVEAQLLRLVNQARADRSLAPLRASRSLRAAAREHSAQMLRSDLLYHGLGWEQRIRHHVRATQVAEALAWGSGTFATARKMVSMWLASHAHRVILLDPTLRRVGFGVRRGRFLGHSGAIVVTADFATRR